eukprot:Hpha_TRINITY_DN15912_c2_g1::TRINITY_DN15912_c2_g1_i2::g.70866::m.70866
MRRSLPRPRIRLAFHRLAVLPGGGRVRATAELQPLFGHIRVILGELLGVRRRDALADESAPVVVRLSHMTALVEAVEALVASLCEERCTDDDEDAADREEFLLGRRKLLDKGRKAYGSGRLETLPRKGEAEAEGWELECGCEWPSRSFVSACASAPPSSPSQWYSPATSPESVRSPVMRWLLAAHRQILGGGAVSDCDTGQLEEGVFKIRTEESWDHSGI